MFALMTNKEIYRGYLQQLQQIYSTNEATVIIDRVFEKVAGLQRSAIVKNAEQSLDPLTLDHLNHCLKELLQYKPVQYVLGEAWFYKMKLTVNNEVLIPRPETEELVQLVVDDWRGEIGKGQLAIDNPEIPANVQTPEMDRRLSMLDIGTGSGCIAIAVKKSLPEIKMQAIDVSAGALSVAKENAISQFVDIRFLQADFLNEAGWEKLGLFDVIISNPPYIPLNEKDKLDKNVSAFEPPAALFVPDHEPVLFYKKIAAFGKKHLSGRGKIYVEMNEDFAKATSKVFEEFYTVKIKKDIFGKERMLIAGFRDL